MSTDVQQAADELARLKELQRQLASCEPPGAQHSSAPPPRVHRLQHPLPQSANILSVSSESSFKSAAREQPAPHAFRGGDAMVKDDDGGVAARTAALGTSCCPNPSAAEEQAAQDWLVKQSELLSRPGIVDSAVAAGCKSAANAERLAAQPERQQTVGMRTSLPDGILSSIFKPIALEKADGRPASEMDDQPLPPRESGYYEWPLPPPLPPLPIDDLPSLDSLTASHLSQMRRGVWDPMTSSMVRCPPQHK